MSDPGIIYVLTNPAMEGYVKIGKTINLEDRLKSLYNTSVPLPFHCNKAVRVNSMKQVEEALHSLLSKNRTNKNREFFEIEPENAYKILDALALEDVTPGQDFVENHSDTEALKRKASQRPPIQMISMLGLKEGDILTNEVLPEATCTVKTDRKVIFQGEETTLTNARNLLGEKHGFEFKGAATVFWNYNGETLRHLYKEYYSDFDT